MIRLLDEGGCVAREPRRYSSAVACEVKQFPRVAPARTKWTNGNALGERPGSGRAPSPPPPPPPPPFTASVSLPAITEAISGRIGACVAAIPSALLPLVRRDGEQSEVTVAGGERGVGGGGASRA